MRSWLKLFLYSRTERNSRAFSVSIPMRIPLSDAALLSTKHLRWCSPLNESSPLDPSPISHVLSLAKQWSESWLAAAIHSPLCPLLSPCLSCLSLSLSQIFTPLLFLFLSLSLSLSHTHWGPLSPFSLVFIILTLILFVPPLFMSYLKI